ncbi:manganese transporter [Arenicella chitinivorans]|uniref:Manganese transporter n=1 Tax=Arenicella chitinivorans TaxID=1329800 RepID=A0A918RRV9_9GAMM|nr:Nramp family divalent metal transporter [Arenicella chitinivorans]GHA06920.1 manganese transporter [Arenicella chitinivorans]
MRLKLPTLGPGVMVTAAFIGPGTVTACTLAGANYGYALLWALLFATLACIVFQEMSTRLGTVTQQGLGEFLHNALRASPWKWPLIILLFIALFGGNSAYQAGNLAGAALGAGVITDSPSASNWIILGLAGAAASILLLGKYRLIERLLLSLVTLMSIAFLISFWATRPDFSALVFGLINPKIPDGSLLTVVALIGTTVVPYNLFLHAAASKARWHGVDDLPNARTDTIVSISLGGLVAILIVSTAAASMFAHAINVQSAADMAIQLEPLFGSAAKYMLGLGLLAAGLSSAITAPLATAFALTELSGQSSDVRSTLFRGLCCLVLLIGTVFALAGIKPIKLILLAQFANGLLLPIIAGFLLYALNQRTLLGVHRNGVISNLLGVIILLITIVLGARSILSVLGHI